MLEAINRSSLFAKRRGDVSVTVSQEISCPELIKLAEQLRRHCAAYLEPHPGIRLRAKVSRIFGDCEDRLAEVFLHNVEIGPTAEVSIRHIVENISSQMRQHEPKAFIGIRAEEAIKDLKQVKRRKTKLFWRCDNE